MNKKYIALGLSIALSMGTLVTAAETLPKQIQESPVLSFTQEELTNLYLEHSIDVEIIDVDQEINQLDYDILVDALEDKEDELDDAKEEYDKKKQRLDNSSKNNRDDRQEEYDDANDTYKDKQKALLDAEKSIKLKKFELDQFDKSKEDQILELTNDFEDLCLDYYTLLKNIELLKANKEIVEEQLSLEKTRLSMGMTTELAVQQTENQLENVELQLEQLNSTVELTVETIKSKIDIDIDTDMKINYSLDAETQPVEITLPVLIAVYKKESLDEKTSNFTLEQEKAYVDKITEIYEEDDDEYIDTTLNYKKLLLEDNQSNINTEIMIKETYYSYKKAIEALGAKKADNELAISKYEEAKAKYELGQMSQLQFKSVEISLKQAQLNYENAVISFLKESNKIELLLNGISITGNTVVR